MIELLNEIMISVRPYSRNLGNMSMVCNENLRIRWFISMDQWTHFKE